MLRVRFAKQSVYCRKRATERMVDGAECGEQWPCRRRKWNQLEKRLQRLKAQYTNGDRIRLFKVMSPNGNWVEYFEY